MARKMPSPPRFSNLSATGNVQIKGLREYQDKLLQLGQGMITKGCVAALGPGADLMRNAARSRAPTLQLPDPRRKPGTVRNAIQAMRVEAQKYAVTFVVGIKLLSSRAVGRFKRKTGRDGRDNPDDPFYGTILEFGKTARTRHPFLKPAFQAAAEPAVKLAGEQLREFTDAEIRRLGSQK